MRKLILGLAVTLLAAVGVSAQSTTVTSTVTDSGSVAWVNGTYEFDFVGPAQVTWPGGTVTRVIKGNLDGSGAFSQSLPDNNTISPSPTFWTFKVCPISGVLQQCYTKASLTITGATQALTVTPPALSIPGSTALPVSAYADAEIAGPVPRGFIYFQVTSSIAGTYRQCEGLTGTACTTWSSIGGGGGTPGGTSGDAQFNCLGVFGNAACLNPGDIFSSGPGGVSISASGGVIITTTGVSPLELTSNTGSIIISPAAGSGTGQFIVNDNQPLPTITSDQAGNVVIGRSSGTTVTINGPCTGCGGLSGGVANAIPVWTSATSIGNSEMTDDGAGTVTSNADVVVADGFDLILGLGSIEIYTYTAGATLTNGALVKFSGTAEEIIPTTNADTGNVVIGVTAGISGSVGPGTSVLVIRSGSGAVSLDNAGSCTALEPIINSTTAAPQGHCTATPGASQIIGTFFNDPGNPNIDIYPLVRSTAPLVAYTNTVAGRTSAFPTTTMVTVGATPTSYRFSGNVTCNTNTTGTATLNLNWTDTSNTSQTLSVPANCTTLGAASFAQEIDIVRGQNGSTITYSVGLTGTANFDIDVRLEKM